MLGKNNSGVVIVKIMVGWLGGFLLVIRGFMDFIFDIDGFGYYRFYWGVFVLGFFGGGVVWLD